MDALSSDQNELENVLQSINYVKETKQFLISKKVSNKNICIPDIIIDKIIFYTYTYYFTSRNELRAALEKYPDNIDKYGNISNWNVSMIIDLSYIFVDLNFNIEIDISNWDVSNVNKMILMFKNSNFNGDISKWNVSKVTDMLSMFHQSNFNGDISRWAVKPSRY
mgnify:FL=1